MIRKILFWPLLSLAAGGLMMTYVHSRQEVTRLEENLLSLDQEILRYETRLGEEVASCEALRLRCREFERLRAEDAAEIRRLGLRLRRAESVARTELRTQFEMKSPLRDTLWLFDTVQLFRWSDSWIEVRGRIQNDSVQCQIRSVDTLVQVVHRIPHRFLFLRWGTKALRQEIFSKNPHSRIVYTEYINIER